MMIDPTAFEAKYLALFLGAFIGGPTLALFSGFLIHQGKLSALAALLVLLLANFLPDVLMYRIGRTLRSHGGSITKKFPVLARYEGGMEMLWKKHFHETLVLAKVSLGLSMPFLASAGYARVPFAKYISHTIGLDLFLIGSLMSIGYYTGSAYEGLVADSNYLAALFAVLCVLFVSGLTRVVGGRARTKLTKKDV